MDGMLMRRDYRALLMMMMSYWPMRMPLHRLCLYHDDGMSDERLFSPPRLD